MLADSNQQLDKALLLTRKAVALKPNEGMFLDSLGWTYYRKKQYARAVEYLRRAAKACPGELEIRQHYAQALEASGDRESAPVEQYKVRKLAHPPRPLWQQIQLFRQKTRINS